VAPPVPVAFPSLQRSTLEPRALRSLILSAAIWVAAIVAAIPLVSVLYMLIVRGWSRLTWELFTELPPAGFEVGGGFGNAIVGTLVMVGIAALLSLSPQLIRRSAVLIPSFSSHCLFMASEASMQL
jgi:phosphate transport system permease protein